MTIIQKDLFEQSLIKNNKLRQHAERVLKQEVTILVPKIIEQNEKFEELHLTLKKMTF